jgi:hypothetical protein
MKSFRLTRRSFLAAVGGAVGLRMLLDNMVASAAGATSPPRFLMTHWPLGTVRCLFKPAGSGNSYTPSPIIQPFVDAGLRADMTVIYGLSQSVFAPSNGGGGHEAGTVMMTTGQGSPGTRSNGGEADDAVAAGPSFDQIFLKNVPELKTGDLGYLNAICDARVDSYETSTRCLSYSHDLRSVPSNQGGSVTEAVPLMPEVSPSRLYASLFAGFMPGGAIPPNQEAALLALKKQKSVLDYSLRELAKLKTLAPSSEQWKIEAHAEAVRRAERMLEQALRQGATCTVPAVPDPNLEAKQGSSFDYGNPVAEESDEASLEQLGRLHMGIITAAFQCDLARVATFQWCPGGNHVAFHGKHPGEPNITYMHHPLSHRAVNSALAFADNLPAGTDGELMQFLANVQIWFNQKHASLLVALKNTKDFYGNSLLDHTVVPYMTEVSNFAHGPRTHLPAFVFGGKALGLQHGQFLDFYGNDRHQNDLWASIAQAYLGSDALSRLSAETFDQKGVQPIPGFWQAP